ncbi:MAG: acyloxyacyl hydrolase, partial [Flavobacteriales bacterium]
TENFSLDIKIGGGLGYIEKPFDLKDNRKNIAIGSKLNQAIVFALNSRWDINEKFKVSTGIKYTHMSNGAFKKPNLGINVPSVHLGLFYNVNGAIEEKESRDSSSTPFQYDRSWNYTIIGGTGLKEKSKSIQRKFWAFTLTGEAQKRIGPKTKWLNGIDLFYNETIRFRLNNKDNAIDNNIESMQIGGKTGIALMINKIDFLIQMGYYLYSKINFPLNVYHRAGIRYQINDRLLFNFSLKTHWAKADHVEIGLGYNF